MRRSIGRVITLLVSPLLLIGGRSSGAEPPEPLVAASVETSFATGGEQIRQFAFDGDPATFFASEKSPAAEDHFTLVLEKPAVLKSVSVTTGRSDGSDLLETGTLEASGDGKTFREIARFEGGKARAEPRGE